MQRFEPKHGEVVAVSNDQRKWLPAIFDTKAEFSDGVNFCIEYSVNGKTRFRFCEPLLKHFYVSGANDD